MRRGGFQRYEDPGNITEQQPGTLGFQSDRERYQTGACAELKRTARCQTQKTTISEHFVPGMWSVPSSQDHVHSMMMMMTTMMTMMTMLTGKPVTQGICTTQQPSFSHIRCAQSTGTRWCDQGKSAMRLSARLCWGGRTIGGARLVNSAPNQRQQPHSPVQFVPEQRSFAIDFAEHVSGAAGSTAREVTYGTTATLVIWHYA
eukprot:179001-Rhodomonas_salina.1